MTCPSCNTENASSISKYLGSHRSFSELQLVECPSCRLVYATPLPSIADLDEYYKSYWHGELASSTLNTRLYFLAQAVTRIRYLKKHIDFSTTQTILDVGAGPGLFLQALQHEKLTANYHAIEPDTTERSKLSKNKAVSAIYASLDNIDQERKYDLIVLSHVLEHLIQPNIVIANLLTKLTTNGILFIEVPNNDHLYKQNFEPHVLFFSAQSLNTLLVRHGNVLDLCSVGMSYHLSKRSADISHIKPHQTIRNLIKTILIWIGIITIEKTISRNHIDEYGNNRQWLRAIMTRKN